MRQHPKVLQRCRAVPASYSQRERKDMAGRAAFGVASALVGLSVGIRTVIAACSCRQMLLVAWHGVEYCHVHEKTWKADRLCLEVLDSLFSADLQRCSAHSTWPPW